MPVWLAVALGGAFGASGRYGTTLLARRLLGPDMPWGTSVVNVIGSLVIGFTWGYMLAKPDTPEWARVGFMTGVLGGFTTLSSLSLETVLFWESGAGGAAFVHAVGNLLFGIAACSAGLYAARVLLH